MAVANISQDCPTGQLTLEELKQIYSKFFPYGEPSRFAEHVFRSFDRNHDGVIDFREFLSTISVTSRGDLNAKLRWAFAIYDLDSDGFISRQDLCDVLTSVYALIGSTIKLPEDETTPERRADKIFSQMDADHDDRLSFDEFADGLKSDKLLFQLLTMNVQSGSAMRQPEDVEAISIGIPEQPVLIGEMNSLLEDGSRKSSTSGTNMDVSNGLVAS
ncbi:hypothetical protein AHF37_05553 [Paragonimus kellicotti]|nr:hypothetical protein AHF37_05553 [Paragonimus kellicotti]